METTVANMSVDELKSLIQNTVKETLEDYIEDLTALQSNSFKESVREARQEYYSGDTVSLEEIE